MKFVLSIFTFVACFLISNLSHASVKSVEAKSPKNEQVSSQVSDNAVRKLKTKSELDQALKEEGVKIFKFTAKWCGPCKMIAKDFASIASTYQNKLKTYEIDADNKEFAAFIKEHEVMGLPTVISLPSKQSLYGSHSMKEYKNFFEKVAQETKTKKVNAV